MIYLFSSPRDQFHQLIHIFYLDDKYYITSNEKNIVTVVVEFPFKLSFVFENKFVVPEKLIYHNKNIYTEIYKMNSDKSALKDIFEYYKELRILNNLL